MSSLLTLLTDPLTIIAQTLYLENISPIKVGKKSKSVSSPPDFYKIFLSIFVFATLILVIIKYLPTNFNVKKIFN